MGKEKDGKGKAGKGSKRPKDLSAKSQAKDVKGGLTSRKAGKEQQE